MAILTILTAFNLPTERRVFYYYRKHRGRHKDNFSRYYLHDVGWKFVARQHWFPRCTFVLVYHGLWKFRAVHSILNLKIPLKVKVFGLWSCIHRSAHTTFLLYQASTHGNHFNPPGDIPEQLAAYSAQALPYLC